MLFLYEICMSNTNDKAFLILTQISTYAKPISVKAVSHDLNMPLSSLYRYISLLKEWNYVEENPLTKEIHIGSTSLLLNKSYQQSKGENREAEVVLERLRAVTGETSVYMVPAGYHALCIASRESQEALRCAFEVGRTQPLVKGATSKVILAHLPAERQHKIAEFYGVDINGQEWLTDLARIHRDGYCISHSEYNEGVVGISVPVLQRRSLLGALTVMAPKARAEGLAHRALQHLFNEASILQGGSGCSGS